MLEKEIKNPSKESLVGRAIFDLPFFMDKIFSISVEKIEGDYISGDHVRNMGKFLQDNDRTMRISAKDHFKSRSFYAHIMWEILRMPFFGGMTGHYFSYKEKMARYHIKNIKKYLSVNPYYEDLIDTKGSADAIIECMWNIGEESDEVQTYTLYPQGLLSFVRGIHDKRVYVDDPLQDPQNRLNMTVIHRINEIFKSVILDMPSKTNGQLHVIGTPQTRHDFFFEEAIRNKFAWVELPAVKSWKRKEVLWEEYMPFEELRERRKIRGTRIFNREYMCSPAWSEDSFFSQEQIENLSTEKDAGIEREIGDDILEGADVVAGWDIGRKVHPSHFVVFVRDVRTGNYRQVHQKFMDRWALTSQEGGQLEYIQRAIKKLKINRVYYDATRGELESLEDRGELPPELEGVIFTAKKKNSMATDFEKLVENGKIKLIDHLRQINQILAVNNDLIAEESTEGHGDSFWSIAMAVHKTSNIRTFTHKPKGF